MYGTDHNPKDNPELQYERSGSPATPYLVLFALIAVVSLIAALAAWTSA